MHHDSVVYSIDHIKYVAAKPSQVKQPENLFFRSFTSSFSRLEKLNRTPSSDFLLQILLSSHSRSILDSKGLMLQEVAHSH